MKYYSHHIGDFDRTTRHLTRLERSIYRDLIDVYYDTEKQLTLDVPALCRKIVARDDEEVAAVHQVLSEFFTETPTGWYHDACEDGIEAFRTSTTQKSVAGKASAAAKAAKKQQAINGGSTSVERASNGEATAPQLTSNQEPLTVIQEPEKAEEPAGKAKRKPAANASRLPPDWTPTDGDAEYCKTKRPDLRLTDVADRFRDYWLGSGGKKVDWNATWRLWVQNERRGPGQGAPPAFQTANEKTKAWADRITGKTRNEPERQHSIIDLNDVPA